jgi:hypothetical protein
MKRIGRGLSPEDGDPTCSLEKIPTRAFYAATLFIFFTGGFYFWWLSVFAVNTVFFHGYPRLGTLLPGALYTARTWTHWYWWMVFLLSWNGLAPMLMAMALTYNRIREWAQAHQFICVWLMVLNGVVLITLTVLWIVDTNNAMSAGATAANDYRYCCVFWPNDWCPNNAACVFDPAFSLTSSSQLERNVEMTAHWAFCFVFFLFSFWHLKYSENLRRNYGVFIKF